MGPWDLRGFAPKPGSELGIAHVSDKQMIAYGLEGLDQMIPVVAIEAMEARISIVQNVCGECCNEMDMFIIAALAQNGTGFDIDDMIKDVIPLYQNEIEWRRYFDSRNQPSANEAIIHQFITGYQYDTEFMLLLYINDIRELHKRGWDLPLGITEEDLDYIENWLIKNEE